MRHVGVEIHLRTPTCKHLCLIFLSGCQQEMQPRPQIVLKWLKTKVVRNNLFISSGFISLWPLNSQTLRLGKQPYQSPKVYRVSYFRSTWKNASISAVDFITKGAFLWKDPDLDLWYKVIKIMVHEKNDVSDELSENFKKYAILRLRTWVSELFPEWFVLLHGLLARTIH